MTSALRLALRGVACALPERDFGSDMFTAQLGDRPVADITALTSIVALYWGSTLGSGSNYMNRGSRNRMAQVRAIASSLPDTVLSNNELAALYSGWTADKIRDKTGISERRIAGPSETACDLAFAAGSLLFQRHGIDPGSIDFLLLCTQTPDYRLPSTACVLHLRLGLRAKCGAMDMNMGCSGFVYGLAFAKGLIESGLARTVLLLTADTYSKLIHPMDRSVRALFGDGAAATLIEAVEADRPMIGPFVFGTDGSGAENLIVPAGGMRCPASSASATVATDASGNTRSADNLFMDGAAVMAFTLTEVPKAVLSLLQTSGLAISDIDTFIFHQANSLMLEALRKKLRLPPERVRDAYGALRQHSLLLDPNRAGGGHANAPERQPRDAGRLWCRLFLGRN